MSQPTYFELLTDNRALREDLEACQRQRDEARRMLRVQASQHDPLIRDDSVPTLLALTNVYVRAVCTVEAYDEMEVIVPSRVASAITALRRTIDSFDRLASGR